MTTDKIDDKEIVRVLQCATHGPRRWKGHVMCDACGLVYQTDSEYKRRAARDVCKCGKRLMPPKAEGDALGMVGSGVAINAATGEAQKLDDYGDEFTARPICYLCFRLVDTRHGGRVPNWIPSEQRKS